MTNRGSDGDPLTCTRAQYRTQRLCQRSLGEPRATLHGRQCRIETPGAQWTPLTMSRSVAAAKTRNSEPPTYATAFSETYCGARDRRVGSAMERQASDAIATDAHNVLPEPRPTAALATSAFLPSLPASHLAHGVAPRDCQRRGHPVPRHSPGHDADWGRRGSEGDGGDEGLVAPFGGENERKRRQHQSGRLLRGARPLGQHLACRPCAIMSCQVGMPPLHNSDATHGARISA